MPLRLVSRIHHLPDAEPITWDESRRLAGCQLKWKLVKRAEERAAEDRREIRRELLVFWGSLTSIAFGWVLVWFLYWPSL